MTDPVLMKVKNTFIDFGPQFGQGDELEQPNLARSKTAPAAPAKDSEDDTVQPAAAPNTSETAEAPGGTDSGEMVVGYETGSEGEDPPIPSRVNIVSGTSETEESQSLWSWAPVTPSAQAYYSPHGQGFMMPPPGPATVTPMVTPAMPPPPPAYEAQVQNLGQVSQPTLARTLSVQSGCFRVKWKVDANKLRKNDKQAVSPAFEFSFGQQYPSVPFKMILSPKASNEKGGVSFRKAGGRGFIQVKCEAELATAAVADIHFRLSIGNNEQMQPARGPVKHNFADTAVSGLPKHLEEWDFSSAVDQASQTFLVCLEIVPGGAG